MPKRTQFQLDAVESFFPAGLLVPCDFDDAVRKVVDILRKSDGNEEGRTKAFLFEGWLQEGQHLGAPAILRAIAKFLKFFHVDCSLWKNRRTMQRAIAEELNLHHVMHIFDKHDKEDDFRGVDDSSREEIPSIARLICVSLRNERFLMIFHYGGAEDIDLVECGIHPFGEGKLLWTCADRFLQPKGRGFKLMPTAANIGITMLVADLHSASLTEDILLKEATGVIARTGMDGINPETVLACFLYPLFLIAQTPENSTDVDYGWATHACNYWICDGILGDEKAWEICNALYGVIARPGNCTKETGRLASSLGAREKSYKGWYSVTSSKQGVDDISNVPRSASSYFLAFHGEDPVYARNDLFHLANNLRVLKLHNCCFDFATPPFQCCQNLRFLWLDHCANMGKEQSGGPTFPNLLVLDLRFTDYLLLPHMTEFMTNLRELNTKGVSWKTMSHAWKKLQKLHKVRITESSDMVRVDSCSSTDMMNLELLDLSGNTHMESLPASSSARSLKMLIIDGCSNLEHVALAMEAAPPLLQSFSFDGYGPAENWTRSIHLPPKDMRLKAAIAPIETVKVTKISLCGCGRLQYIFLRALPKLEELDLSGTAIKILDLSAMDVPKLKKLFLLGCEQLCNLFWERSQTNLEVLYVDTWRNKTRSMVYCGEQGSFVIEACIAFTDGRFIWSVISQLGHIIYGDSINNRLDKVHILISCMNHTQAIITKSMEEICSSQEGLVLKRSALPYNDISLAKDVICSSLVWSRRQLQTLNVHMEIGQGGYNLERMPEQPGFYSFISCVESMHVHDNSSIIAFPQISPGFWWLKLEWCHVESCPRLLSFSGPAWGGSYSAMRIFSASDLLVAYCIWDRGVHDISVISPSCFKQLQHIYLYNCPRLVFVLPISFTLPNLETLQVAYCSKLQHFFPLADECPKEIAFGVTFENLKHIKLYHLHNLEKICEARLTAPALQTVGIRDCWGLRRLPAVTREGPKPVVDCEKDLWDNLEWDGLDAGHDPSLFETRHSACHKKTLPRGSYLR